MNRAPWTVSLPRVLGVVTGSDEARKAAPGASACPPAAATGIQIPIPSAASDVAVYRWRYASTIPSLTRQLERNIALVSGAMLVLGLAENLLKKPVPPRHLEGRNASGSARRAPRYQLHR